MQFKPEGEVVFQYEPNKHLAGFLQLRNTGPVPLMFKFKASNPHKISIKPSPYILKPGEELSVQVAAHREIVAGLAGEQIQILYGAREYSESRNFQLVLENGSQSDKLNLTIMVEEREGRVRKLEEEMNNYSFIPAKSRSEGGKGKGGKVVQLVGVVVAGLILGYFSPVSLFG